MEELIDKLKDIQMEKDTKLLPNNIKKDVTVLGVTGTYEAAMKEYASVVAMNNDIANITVGEVVKVVSGGVTTYYVKKASTAYQPFDFSTLSDGDTISLENMKINNSALTNLATESGDYFRITFSNNNTSVLEFYFVGGRTQITGRITLNNTDTYNYVAAREGNPLILSDANVATINSSNIWNSSTLLEVSSDTLAGSAYSRLSGALLEQVEVYSMVELIKEQDTNKLNLFVQTAEPETKKGIWLQKNATPDYYTYDDEVFIAGEWMENGAKANIPYTFTQGDLVFIGTDIYLFGGGGSNVTAYKYNTLTNTYTKLTNIPYDFQDGGCASVGTDVYLFGSIKSGSYRTAYKYDTLTGTYTQLTNIPYDFRSGACTSIGTDVYLMGSAASGVENYAYKYDTLTGTYTKLTNIPYSSFYSGSCVSIGTDIYLMGSSMNANAAYRYDTLTNTYTKLTNIPYSFAGGGCVSVGTDIYLFGSNSSSTAAQLSAYKYNTLTDTYTQLTNIPYAVKYCGSTSVGTNVYLFGGSDYPTKVQVYALESKTYSQDNLVVINQGKYASVGYEIELYSNPKDVTPPKYAFADVWYYTTINGLETDIPTYYGNGTSWIKIKN